MAKDYSQLNKEEPLRVIDKLESHKECGLVWDEEKTNFYPDYLVHLDGKPKENLKKTYEWSNVECRDWNEWKNLGF